MKGKQISDNRAFILHPSAVILAFGGRCGSRTHRSVQAPTVFGTARRARAQPSLSWRGRPGLNRERRVWNPLVLRLAYAPSMHQGGVEPPRPLTGHSFTGCCLAFSASDA